MIISFNYRVNVVFRASGETWRGKWQGNEIAAKILSVRECTPRISRDFNEEYPKLRYNQELQFQNAYIP